GFLTSKRYGDNTGPDYTYTDAGRLETRTWARTVGGQPLVTTYGYNNAGELTSINYSDSTPDVTYTHDRLGYRKTSVSSLDSCSYSYDLAGQLLSETHTAGVLTNVTVSSVYDA